MSGFDHHCVWINNCIGQENYRAFFVMIIFVWTNFTIFIGAVIFLWTEGQWNMFLGQMITVWIFGGIVAIFWLLVAGLTSFHVYLIYTKQTTYGYLMSRKSAIAP